MRALSEVEYLPDAETGCWEWQRARMHTGYGAALGTTAHRVVWERHMGPVPDGLELDHLCRNKGCVNPAHLEPVTRAVNTQRGRSAKLTEAQVQEIRDSSLSALAVAPLYGVSRNHVYKIRQGAIWKEDN